MLILRRVKHEADITDQAVAISREDAVLGNTTGADRTISSHGPTGCIERAMPSTTAGLPETYSICTPR